MQHNPNLVLIMYEFFTLYKPHWLFGLAKWVDTATCNSYNHTGTCFIFVLACLFLQIPRGPPLSHMMLL